MFYAFTGCDPADFPLHPHDIIQLESIRAACKQGLRWYDFGEVAEDHAGLAQFKGKWGTSPKQLCRY
jgi:lipid II:glycine glycyltransferase (peptidoglycan interpeptide bridge formation enzyme)